MKRIIFLDIDGVLAVPKYDGKIWAICDERQKELQRVLEATNAEIVLSSSWRSQTLEMTKEYMQKNGFWFTDKLIGVTIRAYHYLDKTKKIHLSMPRGVEIDQWIDTNIHSNNGKDFKHKTIGKDFNYVILDDDSDMLLEHKNHFVKCHWKTGLTTRLADKAIKILMQLKN